MVYEQARNWFLANWDPSLSVKNWWRLLAESGWGYPHWPVGQFGKSMSRQEHMEDERARVSVGAFGVPNDVSVTLVAPTLMEHGNEVLLNRYLEPIATGQEMWCQLYSEPGAGSDAGGLRTKAEKSGDHYILNGTKSFISGGGFSDVYVTMVKTDENSISTLVIEKDSEGLSFGGQEKKMGWNSQPTAQVIFEDCKVPVENLIGQEGDGFKIAMMGLDGGRLNIAACSLGTAQSAYERAVQYVGEREQFGKKLQEFQALQFKLADMCTELEASRLILREAAIKVDDNTSDKTKAAAMAKRFVTDAGFNIVNEALQIHGGYGYLKDYPLERNLRDLRVHQILEGTNEIMRVIIAREILKENK